MIPLRTKISGSRPAHGSTGFGQGALVQVPEADGLSPAINAGDSASSLFVPIDSAFLKNVVTPRQFGAVGDGATDDAAAIQAALDHLKSVGGGTLNLEGRIYNFGSTLEIKNANLSASPFAIRVRGVSGATNNIQFSSGSTIRPTLLHYTAKDGSPAIDIAYCTVILESFGLVGHTGSHTDLIPAGGEGTGNGRGIQTYLMVNSQFRDLAVIGFDNAGVYIEESYFNEFHNLKLLWNGIGYEGLNDNACPIYGGQIDLNLIGVKNAQALSGLCIESNYSHGVLIDRDHHRISFHDCYWENNGQADTEETASVWFNTPTPKTGVAMFSGNTHMHGSAGPRNQRHTCVGGNPQIMHFSGFPTFVLSENAGGGWWETGSLTNDSIVHDSTSLGTKLLDRTWNNKANIYFKGPNSYTCGFADIESGSTAVAVSHGWNRVPSITQLIIYKLGGIGSATDWTVGNFQATTFNIITDTNPEQNVRFVWRIVGDI